MRATDIIDAESKRLASVLADADSGATCPTCPEWTAADLLWHITEVHHFWAGVLSLDIRDDADLGVVEASKPPRPATMQELLALRSEATSALIAQLDLLHDDDVRWSWWAADQTVGFTRRMQTFEATMHRIDAELTADTSVGPISAEVAAGAVDHAVDVMWGWLPEWGSYEPRAVVEFVASDADRTWMVEVGHYTGVGPRTGTAVDEPRAVRASAGASSATVTASVRDLALWAWTRGGVVEKSGEATALAALDAVITQGMQ